MVLRWILVALTLAAYIVPVLILTWVNIRARFSKAYADSLGFFTKGDIREFTLCSLIPCINLVILAMLIRDRYSRGASDSTPLHKK